VTTRPVFSGSVLIFNDMSPKESQSSGDAHLSRFWLGVPDLSRHWQLCYSTVWIFILARAWTTIVLQLFRNFWSLNLVAGTLPRTPLWELTMLSQTPKSDPRWLAPAVLAPYDSSLRHSSRIAEHNQAKNTDYTFISHHSVINLCLELL